MFYQIIKTFQKTYICIHSHFISMHIIFKKKLIPFLHLLQKQTWLPNIGTRWETSFTVQWSNLNWSKQRWKKKLMLWREILINSWSPWWILQKRKMTLRWLQMLETLAPLHAKDSSFLTHKLDFHMVIHILKVLLLSYRHQLELQWWIWMPKNILLLRRHKDLNTMKKTYGMSISRQLRKCIQRWAIT